MPPPDSYSIEGEIRINNVLQDGLTVTIQNVTKGTNGTCTTDSLGRYFYDDIQDSIVQSESGDSIRVCTETSGTNSVTFTAGSAEEKVIDFNYILHEPPDWPYSIEGTFTYYDVLQESATVTILNVTKNVSGSCVTDSSGRYFYDDIQDSVIQASLGDTILVSVWTGAASSFVTGYPEEKVIDFENNVMWSCLWKVTITPISGTAYTFQSGDDILSRVTMTLQADGLSSFDFSLINDSDTYNNLFDIGDLIEVWQDSELGIVGTTKRYKGHITDVDYAVRGTNRMLVIKSFDYMGKFQRTIVNELYQGYRKYEDIITNTTDGLIAKYAPEIVTSGVVDTTKAISSNELLKFGHVSLFEALKRIIEVCGDWVFDISPTSVLSFKPRGNIATNKRIYEFDNVFTKYKDEGMCNSAIVIGGQDANKQSKTMWAGLSGNNTFEVNLAYDGSYTTGWSTGVAQAAGQYYLLDLGGELDIGKVFLNNGSAYADNYPRSLVVEAAKEFPTSQIWAADETITTVTNNTSSDIIIDFGGKFFRYIRITLTGSDPTPWAIGEIDVYSYYNVMAKYEDSASIAAHGYYSVPFRDSSITTKSQAFSKAVEEVLKGKDPKLESSSISLAYFFNTVPNELISITVPGTPVSQQLAVQKVTYSEGTKGTFSETIELKSVT